MSSTSSSSSSSSSAALQRELVEAERQLRDLKRAAAEGAAALSALSSASSSRGDSTPQSSVDPSSSQSASIPASAAASEPEHEGPEGRIGRGNIGHALLRKMGWAAGEGLGAHRQGMVAPVATLLEVKEGKGGLGGGSDAAAATSDPFVAYRQQLSAQHKQRAQDRGPRK